MPNRILLLVPATSPPPPYTSDAVVILAALLCALICVVGLALVFRCALFRRSSSASSPPKGLKPKSIGLIPKLPFRQAASVAGSRVSGECAICLVEFGDEDEVRVLPWCGHGFHVECVDVWLGRHSSCPSCRTVLGDKEECRRCGGDQFSP